MYEQINQKPQSFDFSKMAVYDFSNISETGNSNCFSCDGCDGDSCNCDSCDTPPDRKSIVKLSADMNALTTETHNLTNAIKHAREH